MGGTEAAWSALALAVALAAPVGASPPAGRPSVLLVTVDTLRPDALGWVAGRASTPAFDRLARAGVAFPAAVSPVPLTLPAHVSLFTGRLPRHHGVRDNGQLLPGSALTLAERLREAGYRTAAFVSGFPLERAFGLEQGFTVYDDTLPEGQEGWLERRAHATTDAALAWLRATPGPFFLWVHYYDPHDPYDPPRPYWRSGPRGAYDGEVAFVDLALGRLLEAAGARGGPLLTVQTADHGEALGEHRELTHGYFVYDSTMLVPLVFHWPGRWAATRRTEAPRLVDVAPTILELLGLPPLPEADGVSLVRLLDGRPQELPPAYLETRLPFTYYGWAPLRALREASAKLIEAPRPEFYALAGDPGEARPLDARGHPDAVRLRARMAEIESRSPASAATATDPELLERLRALGYVGAGASSHEVPTAGLADPKDRIELRDRLSAAEGLLRAGRLGEAQAAFEAVLSVEPRNRAAALRAGVAWLRLGRLPEAVRRLELAVELDPERAEARFALADALMRSGRPDAAVAHWLELTHLQPGRTEGWHNLGTALVESGRPERAVAAFQSALALSPRDTRVLVALGRAERRAGRLADAVTHLQQASRLAPAGRFEAAGALGLALARRGLTAEARPWLERAGPGDPDLAEARLELARLLAR